MKCDILSVKHAMMETCF